MNDEKLDYLITKIDIIASDVVAIKVLDAVQNEQLKQHMKRSDLLEKRVEQVDAKLEPIRSYFSGIRVIMTMVGALGLLLGLIETVKRLL